MTAFLIITIILTTLILVGILLWGVKTYDKYQREHALLAMVGEEAMIVEWNGHNGRVYARKRTWPAISDNTKRYKQGERVLISRINGKTLKVNPIEHDMEDELDLLP